MLGIIAGGAFFLVVAWSVWPAPFVPPEFAEARIRGARIAHEIAEAAGKSLDNLATIRVYDEKGETAEALILISQEIIQNREAQVKAIALSSELEKMARLLSDIKPSGAKSIATEAVSAEVALVSRLISYNDNLRELFSILREKFEKPGRSFDGTVQTLIERINEDARAINSFNERFNWSLAEFDKIFLN